MEGRWSMEAPQKIGILYDPGIPLLGIYPKKTRPLIQKDICIPMFITALFTIANKWKQPKCPSVDELIKKRWYIYKMECFSAINKNKSYHLQQHEWS